jgi:hypothetical protein
MSVRIAVADADALEPVGDGHGPLTGSEPKGHVEGHQIAGHQAANSPTAQWASRSALSREISDRHEALVDQQECRGEHGEQVHHPLHAPVASALVMAWTDKRMAAAALRGYWPPLIGVSRSREGALAKSVEIGRVVQLLDGDDSGGLGQGQGQPAEFVPTAAAPV